MKKHPANIVAIGEILWDMFASGPRFGGAPANFAHYAALFGASVSLVSRIGNDELGNDSIQQLHESSINTRFVTIDAQRPTGKVDVQIDSAGHAIYRFNRDEAWDHIPFSSELEALADRADAVCFGTLSQRHSRSRETVRKFVQATQPFAWRVLDLNLREPFYDDDVIEQSLSLANILKVNDDELKLLAARYAGPGDEIEQAKQILLHFNFSLVAVTRGVRGSVLVSEDEVSDEPSQAINVVDTVGAGDSYTAAVVIGLIQQKTLTEINRTACRLAEYVCTQAGATPKLSAEFLAHTLQAISNTGPSVTTAATKLL